MSSGLGIRWKKWEHTLNIVCVEMSEVPRRRGGDANSTDELGSRASLKDLEIALHAFTNAGREAKFECAAGVGFGSVDNRGSR